MEEDLSSDRYTSTFLEFRRMSDQSEKMKRWVKEKLDEFMNEDGINSEDECRILGIGSGVGELDCYIFENLRRKHNNLFARVVEPNAVEMDHFKDRVGSDRLFDVVDFDWRLDDAVNYLNETPDKRFHIIHIFHVLYYFDEREFDKIIERCYNQLEEGGHLLIIQGSATNDVLHLRRTFSNDLNMKGLKNSINGEDLLYIMDTLRYTYDTNIIQASLDVTACLDLTLEIGNLLWDFITCVQEFVKRSPQTQVRQIKEMVEDELSFTNNGRTYVRIDSMGIDIYKTIVS